MFYIPLMSERTQRRDAPRALAFGGLFNVSKSFRMA